jgi:K(+)-stimulated pyrophosphate-energized sodium pump
MLIGGMLPFIFAALTMNAVGRSANKMIEEVRRQFRTIPGLLEGTAEPDSARCVAISTQAAIREMIAARRAGGDGAGADGIPVGRLGARRAAGRRAGDRRGAGPDDGQRGRRVGQRQEVHRGRPPRRQGIEPHKAAVIGDTVGDPFKDTSGPSLNILIKLMSIVAVIFAPLVVRWLL